MSVILKSGPAQRVIFYYPGEEGTYVEAPEVTLYDNGIVHILAKDEEVTSHISNCEIIWHQLAAVDPANPRLHIVRSEK